MKWTTLMAVFFLIQIKKSRGGTVADTKIKQEHLHYTELQTRNLTNKGDGKTWILLFHKYIL